MNYEALKDKICGPMELPLTAYDSNGDIDLEAFKDQLNYLVENGHVTGKATILIGGATAQFFAQSIDERKKVIEAAVRTVDGKVPLIFGAQHSGTRQAIELAKHAADVGADIVQLSFPYYYHNITDDITLQFFQDVANAVDAGILIYNTPWQGYDISAELLETLAQIDNVVATKWSSSDPLNYRKGYRKCADKLAMIDNTMANHLSLGPQLGASGFIACIDNFAPSYDLELWELLESRKYQAANDKMLEFLVPFYNVIFSELGESIAIYEAMKLVGRPIGTARPPEPSNLSKEGKKKLRELLSKVGVELEE